MGVELGLRADAERSPNGRLLVHAHDMTDRGVILRVSAIKCSLTVTCIQGIWGK